MGETPRIVISPELDFDASELSTQRLAILGASGSGKTYLGTKIAEQLHAARAPFIVLDAVGKWAPGLRVAADGKSPGLPIVVIGGSFGDLPLEPTRGAELGRFLRERQASAIVDISAILGEHAPFVADFCRAVYMVSQRLCTPFTLIYEEAQYMAPQQLEGKDDKRMLSAVKTNVRLGRNQGLGTLMLSQRPESVSKEVLSQCDLFVGLMKGPHERKSIQSWVADTGAGDLKAQLAELPRLQPGEFFFWSPSWLGRFVKVKVEKKWTFDASKTPSLGSQRLNAAALSPVDLGELRALLARSEDGAAGAESGEVSAELATVRAELATVRAELAERIDDVRRWRELYHSVAEDVQRVSSVATSAYERIVRAGNPDGVLDGPERRARLGSVLESMPEVPHELDSCFELDRRGSGPAERGVDGWMTTAAQDDAMIAASDAVARREPPLSAGLAGRLMARQERRARAPKPAEGITDYERDVLAAAAQHGPVTRLQLGILSGKSAKSSQFSLVIGRLKDARLLEEQPGKRLAATAEGRALVGSPRMPRGRALYEYWASRFGDYDRKTFAAVAHAKRGCTRDEIAKAAGHSPKSSQFSESVNRFKRLDLFVEQDKRIQLRSEVRALMGL